MERMQKFFSEENDRKKYLVLRNKFIALGLPFTILLGCVFFLSINTLPAQTGRMLQSDIGSGAIPNILSFLAHLFAITRSLSLIVIATNKLDLFMPLLIFMEIFNMMGLFTNTKHYLNTFYFNVFNLKLDLMNLIRVSFKTQKNPNTLEILSRYNFNHEFFYNISGEFILILVCVVITLALKVIQIRFKSQKVRYAALRLRSVWNGLAFYLMPRMLTFVGYQLRSITQSSATIILNTIFACIILIAYMVFFMTFISHLKKILRKYEYLDDSVDMVGLCMRYNYDRQYEFDLFSFSTVFTPAVAIFRHFLSFICIGCAHDFHYLQYGIIIFSQSYSFLSHFCFCYYRKLTDRLFYAFTQFLLFGLVILIIALGFTEEVSLTDSSQKVEIIIVSFMITLIVSYIAMIVIDFIQITCLKTQDLDSRKSSNKNFIVLKKSLAREKSTRQLEINNTEESEQTIKKENIKNI